MMKHGSIPICARPYASTYPQTPSTTGDHWLGNGTWQPCRCPENVEGEHGSQISKSSDVLNEKITLNILDQKIIRGKLVGNPT